MALHIQGTSQMQVSRASTSHSIKKLSIAPHDTNPQSEIVATGLAWAYHAKKHVSPYCSQDCSMKRSEVPWCDSRDTATMSCGRTKEDVFMTYVVASDRAERIFVPSNQQSCYFSVSSPNHGNKMFSLALRYFDLGGGGGGEWSFK